MSKVPHIIAIFCLFFGVQSLFAKSKTVVHSVSKEDMLLLKKVDSKYQKQHGIHMQLKKTITLGMLGSTKKSEGEVWLSGGKMRLEIKKPEPSKIVAGSEYLWIESPPPEGFKGVKTQVMRASLKSKRAKSQGLIQLLTMGGVLKYFRVSGVKKAKNSVTFFLQPDSQSIEFKRAQLQVTLPSQQIKELRYWDQMDNETAFEFINPTFNKKIDSAVFKYKPPEDAEVMTY